MAKENKKSHTRAPGMTQISISLPQRLVDKIDQLAEIEKRSRSNYIAFIVDGLPIPQSEQSVPFLQAAEPKQAFNSK